MNESSTLERLPVPLPSGFDPDRHMQALLKLVADKHGAGWQVESVNLDDGKAMLVRQQAAVMQQVSGGAKAAGALKIRLPAGTKPTDGDRIAKRQSDLYPGFHLVRFDPHLGVAYLAKMSEDELRCREAVATALRVKPWEVTCRKRRDGGYTLRLPGRYTPGKDDDALLNVAENVVGKYGWYVVTDPMTLQCEVIPGDPPTFPDAVPLNLPALGSDQWRSEFGLKLPAPGVKEYEPASIDWGAQAFLLVSGIPGSGKSVTINDITADQLAGGAELVIVDDFDKSEDFKWAKPFVRDGGWGCEDLRSAVAALGLAREECSRRSLWMKERGYNNWTDIPDGERFKPLFVVVDEASALLTTDRLPAGVPKSSPEVQAVIERNLFRFRLFSEINDFIQRQRFVGGRLLISSQITNASTGIPPSLKGKIGHKMLQGTNPSKVQRTQSFSEQSNVPTVPENLQGGGKAAKGVGAAELEAQPPFIYKGYFAPVSALASHMERLGLRKTSRPEPTPAEVDRLCPLMNEEDADLADDDGGITVGGNEWTPSGKPAAQVARETGIGPVEAYGDDGKRLSGAAAAARALKQARPRCPACDREIDADGLCGCSR